MNERDQPQTVWLEGAISIEAALRGRSRTIEGIFVEQGRSKKGYGRLVKLASKRAIPLESVPSNFISENASGRSHGGILARVGPRRFQSPETLLAENGASLIVMLDGIEDPFNFGQAIRALFAAGVNGLVVRPRNWLNAAATVARASAGCSELMPMAIANGPQEAASLYRNAGLQIACTANRRATSVFAADLTAPLFLLIGGERRGVSRAFIDQADLLLRIPYGRTDFKKSLGSVAAASIFAFEAMRQRT